MDLSQQISFREAVGFTQFFGNSPCQQFFYGVESLMETVPEMFLFVLCQIDQHVQRPVRQVGLLRTFSAFFTGYFIIGDGLFKRQFKRISDVMEERCQSPEFQKHVGSLQILFPVRLIRAESVMAFEGFSEVFVCFIDGKTQCEHINGMGIMVPVLHQQGTAVRLILREQFHHLFGFAVTAEEYFQITVVNIVGILCNTGVDEMLQLSFQAQPVDVHLHIVWDLAGIGPGSLQYTVVLFIFSDFFIKIELFTLVMDKTQSCRFQVVAVPFCSSQIRLDRSGLDLVGVNIFEAHILECCICHLFLLHLMCTSNCG